MLQIKTIPKNISTLTSWNFSPLHTFNLARDLTNLARDLTNLARKQLNVNTNTLQLFLAPKQTNISSLKTNNKQISLSLNNNNNIIPTSVYKNRTVFF